MKKLIILSILLILGLSLVAYSASQKLDFYVGPQALGILSEGSFAIVNFTPKDAANLENENDTVLTIQIQVRGLDPGEYTVILKLEGPAEEQLGILTIKKNGSGSFHYNVTIPEWDEHARRLRIHDSDGKLELISEGF